LGAENTVVKKTRQERSDVVAVQLDCALRDSVLFGRRPNQLFTRFRAIADPDEVARRNAPARDRSL